MRRTLLAMLAALWLAGHAVAATCPHASGSLHWTTVTEAFGSCGSPTGADLFRVTGGDVVVDSTYGSPIAMTHGQIEVDGGTLLLYGPTRVTFSGSETLEPYVEVKNGTLAMEGYPVYQGRVQTDPTWSEGAGTETATVTLDVPIPSWWSPTSATGNWIRFLADDPLDPNAGVTDPVQVGVGFPQRGKYRWSAAKWMWFPITAVSGNDVTFSTDAYGDIESGADANIYTGTRGQGLSTATALSELTRLPHGQGTRLSITGFEAAVDNDLTDQYIEFVTGTCAGWRARITDVRKVGAADDQLYIEGDASFCGLASTVRVNFGIRQGDLVEIVAAPQIDGGNAATIRWNGGRVRISRASIEHLDDSEGTNIATPELAGWCNFCVYQQSASVAPDFANSWIEDNDLAYWNTTTQDVSGIGFMSLNQTNAAFRFPTAGAMNASELRVQRNWFHDQWNNVSGFGVHAIRSDGSIPPRPVHNRCTRMGDDCFYATQDSIGTGVGQPVTIRHWIAEAGRPATTNSQQGVNAGVAPNRSSSIASELPLHTLTMSDVLIVGIQDGPIDIDNTNGVLSRSAIGGGNSSLQIGMGVINGVTPAPATGSIASQVRNLIYFGRGSTSSAQRLVLGGSLYDSVVYGFDLWSGSTAAVANVVGMFNSFLDLSSGSSAPDQFFGRQSNTYLPYAVPRITLSHIAMMGGRNLAGGNGDGFVKLCDNIDGGGVLTDVVLDHVFIGARRLSQANGFFSDCVGGEANIACTASSDPYACCTGLGTGTCVPDGTHTATINGLTLTATTTASMQGLGCASAPGGTLCAAIGQGATVTNARVEASIARTGITAFGANATSSSSHVAFLGPDVSDLATPSTAHAPISAFVDSSRSDMPHRLGITELGTEQALLGDAFLNGLDKFTTDADLLRRLQVDGGSAIVPGTVYP